MQCWRIKAFPQEYLGAASTWLPFTGAPDMRKTPGWFSTGREGLSAATVWPWLPACRKHPEGLRGAGDGEIRWAGVGGGYVAAHYGLSNLTAS